MDCQIEIQTVRSALEAMRQALPLGPAHPLRQLVSIQQAHLATSGIDGQAALDTTIFDTLAQLISRRLKWHRRICSLTPMLPEAPYDGLKQDFHAGNTELEAWSILYYRYVRVDLDLAVEQLETLLNIDRRTLNRRQSKGIYRLTSALIRRERRTRRKQRAVALRSQLPAIHSPKLFGREVLLESALRPLKNETEPKHLVLYGAAGIGKTALALALAHLMIDQTAIQHIAWIDQPEASVERVIDELSFRLGLSCFSPEQRPTLETYLQMVDSLIVLDQADVLSVDTLILDELLEKLGAARVIICAQQPPGSQLEADLARLLVPGLDKPTAFALLDYYAHRLERKSVSPDVLNQLYDEIGGNPRALRLALLAGKRYDPSVISADIYQPTWNQILSAARLTWLIVALYPHGKLTAEVLSSILPDESTSALLELEDHWVIEPSVEVESTILLIPLARAFAESRLLDDSKIVQNAFQRLADYLAETPDPACIRLLTWAQKANLSISIQLDFAYTFEPVLTRAGAWATWSRYLEGLLNAATGSDRLWAELQLGIALRWLMKLVEAAYGLAEVIEKAGQAGDFTMQAQAMVELAAVYRSERQYAIAEDLLERADNLYKRRQLIDGQQRIAAERLQILLDNHDQDAANVYLQDILNGFADLSPRLLSLSAQVALQAGDFPAALRWATRAQSTLADDLPKLARLMSLLGQIYHELNDDELAVNHWLSAAMMTEQTQDLLGHARTQLNLAAHHIARGHVRLAMQYLQGLPATLEQLGDVEGLEVAVKNLELVEKALKK